MALVCCMQQCTNCIDAEVCIFFQMSQNGVCIRSVIEQKIGPYKVCIFVNIGPFEKLAALILVRGVKITMTSASIYLISNVN